MTKGVFIRSVTGLVPDDDQAREALQGVAIGAGSTDGITITGTAGQQYQILVVGTSA